MILADILLTSTTLFTLSSSLPIYTMVVNLCTNGSCTENLIGDLHVLSGKPKQVQLNDWKCFKYQMSGKLGISLIPLRFFLEGPINILTCNEVKITLQQLDILKVNKLNMHCSH